MARGARSRSRRTSKRATARRQIVSEAAAREAAQSDEQNLAAVTAAARAATAPAESPERALLEQVRVALDDSGDDMGCSVEGCGHAYDDHAGTDGPCSIDGCACDGFVPAADAVAEVVSFVPSDALIEDAVAALTAATPAAAPIVRMRLEELRLVHFAGDAVVLPDEHAPGERVPRRGASPAEVTPPETPDPNAALRWTAALVPEGKLTDDGRAMAPGAITWRELPLTLMAMVETTEGGHVGALVAGRIDRIYRDGSGMIRGEGVFDEGDYGAMIAGLVADQTLRGVSVDLAVHSYEVGPRSQWFDEDGNWAPTEAQGDEPDLLDVLFGGEDNVFVVTEGVIGAATVCPFQAFADATIELAASLVAGASPALWTVTQQAGFVLVAVPKVAEATGAEAEGVEAAPGETVELTASAAGIAPVVPPADWFADPQLAELTPLTVTEDGRVYGHAAQWGTCHIGIPDVCTVAPHTATGNAYFHLGEILCEGGARFSIGKITMGTGHADRGLGWKDAAAHYDDTGTVVADVFSGEDEHGIWVAGALRPNVDAERARELRAATLSGDWRNVNGNLELVALLAVNVPGFPVPRTRALVSSGEDGTHVLALVAAGIYAGADRADVKFRAEAAKLAAQADRERFAALGRRARDAA